MRVGGLEPARSRAQDRESEGQVREEAGTPAPR